MTFTLLLLGGRARGSSEGGRGRSCDVVTRLLSAAASRVLLCGSQQRLSPLNHHKPQRFLATSPITLGVSSAGLAWSTCLISIHNSKPYKGSACFWRVVATPTIKKAYANKDMATDQNQLPIAPPDTMKRLKEIIAGGPNDSAWDDAWKGGVTPWDAKAVQPPLRTLIDSARFPLPKEGRALVPGCGSGYDAVFIAESLGLHTVAVDISPTALDAGRTLLASLEDPALASKLTFLEADFFELALPEDKKFDLVYDYTFFVAIPPARRLEWGRQISALTKPGAYLITLMFPLDQDPSEQGPPHYLQPEHYDAPLKGWTKLVEEVPPVSLPTHVDREHIAVWEKLA